MDSGNSSAKLFNWAAGSDPCADDWHGVCCAPGGWDYIVDDHNPTCGGGGGSVVTGVDLPAAYSTYGNYVGGLTGDVGALAGLGAGLATVSFRSQHGVAGELSELAPLVGLTYLDLRYCTAVSGGPLTFSTGRSFYQAGNPHGYYSGADDVACAAVPCSSSLKCVSGACMAPLLAFVASGNGGGKLFNWAAGGDPCADGWHGVCCAPGGWDYSVDDHNPTCGGGGGSVVTGVDLPAGSSTYSQGRQNHETMVLQVLSFRGLTMVFWN